MQCLTRTDDNVPTLFVTRLCTTSYPFSFSGSLPLPISGSILSSNLVLKDGSVMGPSLLYVGKYNQVLESGLVTNCGCYNHAKYCEKELSSVAPEKKLLRTCTKGLIYATPTTSPKRSQNNDDRNKTELNETTPWSKKIPTDPMKWSVDDVSEWLDRMAVKYSLKKPIDKYYFQMNGLGVAMIPCDGFIRRVGKKGLYLYRDFHHLLKTTRSASLSKRKQ